jgi:hypothetical protein
MNVNRVLRQLVLLSTISLTSVAGISVFAVPAVTIKSPGKSAIVTNSFLTVTGATHDTAAVVTNVVVKLNGSNLTVTPAPGHGYTNWTAAATNLPPGTNTLAAYAIDTKGAISTTNTVTFFYKLTAKLAVTINGRGSLDPNYAGKELNINENYKTKAIPAPGFGFLGWITARRIDSFENTNVNLTFLMVSNLQLIANFVDIQPPTVTITTKNSAGSNSVAAVSGTAKDNVGVTSVWCQAGNNGWNLAFTGNAFANWTASLVLSPGTNIIYAYAEDAAGNRSKTNSVTLNDKSTGLAPESIAGTMMRLSGSNGSAVLGFNESSFSIAGSNGVSSGVGCYTYMLSDSNTAVLTITFLTPPSQVSDGDELTLSFANGIWTDTNANSGEFTLGDASATAPDSLSGLTLQSTAGGTNVHQFTNEYGDGTFTTTDTNGSSSGTYTYEQYSPMAGLLEAIYTNGADLGTTNYVLLDFSADLDTYYEETDTSSGATNSNGTFNVSGETITAGYTAPVSLAGWSAAVTQKGTNGQHRSFVISLDDSTFSQFTTDTNHDCGVGTYTYTRTGAKTAQFINTFIAPPEEAANGGGKPVYFSFTGGNSANFTNAEAHGTITFSHPGSMVPVSLAGRKFTGYTSGGNGTYSFGYETFTFTSGNNNDAGTYTYATYGPQVALATIIGTSKTKYLELWFSTPTGGSFRQDNGSGSSENKVTVGTFTMH